MKRLAELDLPDLVTALTPLTTGYRAWIDQQEARIADPASHLTGYRQDAADALAAARRAADRIEAGIGLLNENEAAMAAFRFANQAMWQQRVHTLAAEARTRDDTLSLDDALTSVDEPTNRSWRPVPARVHPAQPAGPGRPDHPDRAEGAPRSPTCSGSRPAAARPRPTSA